jgi:hypothetical protein
MPHEPGNPGAVPNGRSPGARASSGLLIRSAGCDSEGTKRPQEARPGAVIIAAVLGNRSNSGAYRLCRHPYRQLN